MTAVCPASSGARSEGARWAVAGHVLDFDDPPAAAAGAAVALGLPAERPPTPDQLRAKLDDCVGDLTPADPGW